MHGHKESNKDLNLKILTSEWDSNRVCVCVFWEREGGEHPICTDTRRVIKI